MWLWVDFNAVEDDTIRTSVRRTPSVSADELVEGRRVELRDHEGNRCWGVITRVRGPIIYLDLDWSTWVPAQDEENVALRLTTGNPSTGSLLGSSFKTTKRFHGPVPLTDKRRTGALQS